MRNGARTEQRPLLLSTTCGWALLAVRSKKLLRADPALRADPLALRQIAIGAVLIYPRERLSRCQIGFALAQLLSQAKQFLVCVVVVAFAGAFVGRDFTTRLAGGGGLAQPRAIPDRSVRLAQCEAVLVAGGENSGERGGGVLAGQRVACGVVLQS